ncbi:telomere length regulation protein-domain-containing protein [Lipomyces arxii]|uniref:telomere length regulation protein-domain-containing protein n=1 Tax=Lipomyces arxii TaxID=56418 RepID=UPI0034CD5875
MHYGQLNDFYKSKTEILKNSPSLDDFEQIITEFALSPSHVIPSVECIRTFSVLIGTTIPEFYHIIKQDGKLLRRLHLMIASLPGISVVVSIIGQDSEALLKFPQDDYVRNRLLCLLDILLLALSPGILDVLYRQVNGTTKEQLYMQDIMSLFVGSRLISTIAYARQALNDTEEQPWWWISEGGKMSDFVANELANSSGISNSQKYLAKFVSRCLNLGYSNTVFERLLNKSAFHVLRITNEMSSLDLSSFIKNFLHYLRSEFLKESAEQDYVNCSSTVLFELIPPTQSRNVIKILVQQGIGTQPLHRAVALWLVSHGIHAKMFESLLRQWGDSLFIKYTSLTRQEVYTELIFLLLTHIEKFTIHKISQEPFYLEAISNRLQAMSGRARIMGMGVAKAINLSDQSGIPLDFNEVDEFNESYKKWNSLMMSTDRIIDLENVWPLLQSKAVKPFIDRDYNKLLPDLIDDNAIVAKSGQLDADSDDEEFPAYAITDEDSEDSDDDPTMRAQKILPPVYLIDLIKYLGEPDAKTALPRQKVALENASGIILRKMNYGSELSSSSKELATILCGLKNTYDLPNFENQKMDALVALVITVPETVGSHFAENITFGDYSMQEKLMMMSAIAIGAQHLAGKSTYNFGIKGSLSLFASKLLPDSAHMRFAAPQDVSLSFLGVGEVENAVGLIQKTALQDSITKATDDLSTEAKVLRISARLLNERQRESKPGLVQTRSRLAKIAGMYMFFPLAAHWRYFLASVSKNSFAPMLVAHYIKTLAVIVDASFPLAHDITDMSMELFDILSTIKRDISEANILEAILTAVLVTIQVNDETTLISTFGKELIDIKDFLDLNWEAITDKNVHSLAAGVLIKIGQLLAQHQRRLIGAFNV